MRVLGTLGVLVEKLVTAGEVGELGVLAVSAVSAEVGGLEVY